MDPVFLPNNNKQKAAITPDVVTGKPGVPPVPLLSLHGNIAYTFDYRARLDTPFAASNLQQHNEQVYADAVVKGRWPFRIYVNSRQSNSPYFKNYTDVNVQFNHRVYQQGIKDAMIAAMIKKTGLADSTRKIEQLVNARKNEYYTLKSWVDDPARVQDAVREKEKLYQQVLDLSRQREQLSSPANNGGGIPPLPAGLPGKSALGQHELPLSKDSVEARLGRRIDSLTAKMNQPGETEGRMKQKQKLADSLYKLLIAGRHQIDSLRRDKDSMIRDYTTKVRSARSTKELEDLERSAGTDALKGSDKPLLSLTHFGIGRSAVNYSDLTVNNISLNGVNVEYNPSYYAAFAAGSVDYLFRDFVVQPGNTPRQNLVLGRFGWGDKDRRIFIFTVYNGTKNSFGGSTGTSIPTAPVVNNMHIFGYSLEMKYKLDRNRDISLEAAKSSAPYESSQTSGASMQHAFAFSDRNNEAFSAKFNMAMPATHTTLNVFYKLIGANFQSYSIFHSGTRQEGWGIRVKQYFFRDQLSVNVQVKKSDFDDPLLAAGSGYSSSMLFKSVQVIYRKRKWPVLTAGYMPSTQLLKSSNGTLSESVYYALTAGAFYDYNWHGLHMNSALNYSQFYNRGTDSGFVRYNASTILYTHGIDMGRIHTQTDIQYTGQPDLRYWVWQQRLDCSIGRHLTIGAGVKNDYIPASRIGYWGGSGEINLRIGDMGSLRVQYNKDYLPSGSGTLVKSDWGRAIFIKLF